MNREQLEHLIRAAGDLLSADTIIIVGSQAILASYPEGQLPAAAIRSFEVDVLPIDDAAGDQADRVDGAMGELSRFHETFGIYADGVSISTITVPSGWRDRLVPYSNVNTNGVTGLCLEPHDLCVAKMIAGREKDWQFVRELVADSKANPVVLRARLEETPISDVDRSRLSEFVNGLADEPDSR